MAGSSATTPFAWPAAPSTAVAAYLGFPWRLLRRALDPLRQIELAETSLHFRGTVPVHHDYDAVLRRMPGELALHYKVWKLLLATKRGSEVEASHRAACARVACDPGVAAYHACVVSSAALHDGCEQPRHIIELPQPLPPPELAEEAGDRLFFGFNPAIVGGWRGAEWLGLGDGDDDGDDEFDDGAWNRSRLAENASSACALRVAGARPSRTWLVFFRYSNVESVWSRQSEPWQHERWLDGRAADERTTRQWVGGELDELEALDVAAETRELLAAAGDRLEGEIQAELEHATLVAGGITVEERWRRLMEQSVPTPPHPPPPANASVAAAAILEEDDEDGALQVFDVEEAGGVEFAVPETSKPDLYGNASIKLIDGGDSVIGYYALRSEGGRLRVAGGPQWLTLRHPFDAACTTESAPNRTDCAASEASAACLSEGQRPTALLLFVLLLAAAGLRELWRAVRRARAGGLRKLPLAQVARGLLLLAGTLPFRLCGGLAEGCGDKAFRYAGFEDARAVTHGGELYLIANHEDCHGRRRLCLLKLGLTGGDGDGGGGLQQAHVWPLRIDGVELHDVEKNWSPFVHDGELLMSYSVEPHVVLRCAWVGGACEVAHNSSNPFLATYLTLGQVLRGGTPYARLGDGSLLGAMHVKDGAHAPALYHTIFYLVDGTPPFRVRSLSPKLCFSRRPAELPLSPTCALQYAVGLAVDEAADVALVSLGEMDRRMKVAALPLARTLALARTHMLHDAEVAESDCVAWG